MEFDKNQPIHIQLVDEFKRLIVTGKLESGEKINSVREYAEEMGVNPNTMQKAMATLEQMGLVYTERTSGRYVTNDKKLINEARIQMTETQITEFMERMESLGLTPDEIIEQIRKYTEEGHKFETNQRFVSNPSFCASKTHSAQSLLGRNGYNNEQNS